jgi:predicted permease
METHLSLLMEDAQARGLNPKEAVAEARRRFGSHARHFESTREADLSRWLDEVGQDICFALRQTRRNSGFTLLAAVVIGMGIGAVTTIFSLVDAVLIRSLPYSHPESLVYVWTPNPLVGALVPKELGPNFPDFYDWRRSTHSFASLSTLNQRAVNLVNGGSAKRIGAAFVSAGFFETLGAKPQLGRTIGQADDQPGDGNVVVVGDAVWHEVFSGRRDAIGKTLTINRQRYRVIGVMPKSFGYPFEGDIPYGGAVGIQRTDLWMPLALGSAQKADRIAARSGDAVIGRLSQGVSLQQAQRELALIEKRLDVLYPPGWMQGWEVLVVSLTDTIFGPVTRMLWLLMGAVGLVLLIACGNIGNLLLARVTGRLEEIAVRAGLGAGRGRLARQLLTESLLLALLGGALGIALALGGVRVLAQLNPGNIPRFEQASVNLPVLALAVGVSLLSGVLFSMAPIQAALRTNLAELLKSGNRGRTGSSNRLRHTLVVTEVALSFVLLAGATLLIRSYLRLEAQDTGFSRSTITMRLALDSRYNRPEQRTEFFLGLIEKLRRLPGVIQAGGGSDLPLDHSESVGWVEIQGYGQPKDMVDIRWVTPGYFQAMGMRLLAGRFFDPHDMKNVASAVIVNQAFVNAYMHGRDPLTVPVRSAGSNMSSTPWASVVGVVADWKHTTLEEAPRPEYFHPYRPSFNAWDIRLAILSTLPAQTVVPAARESLRGLDPVLAFDDIRTMDQRVAEASARRRFQMALLTAFAALAVFLAMMGIYGVMAYSVRQRTQEIGLRMALGASGQQVLAMVVQQGLGLVAIGLVIGVAGALVLTQTIRTWLFGVAPNDPLTFVLLPPLILAVAGCASIFPARRASRVDPATAIRNE